MEQDPDELARLETHYRTNPEDPDATEQLGLALAAGPDPVRALPYLEKAVALRPDSPRAHYNLGVLCLTLLRLDAEQDWEWAEDHQDSWTYYLKAQSAFELALTLDPNLEEARANLKTLEDLNPGIL